MVANLVSVDETVQVLPNPYALSIKPRLEYCVYLVGSIMEKIQNECEHVGTSNLCTYSQNDGSANDDPEFKKQVQAESSLVCATEILEILRHRLKSISQFGDITVIVSPLISIIRVIHSNIYANMPQISHDLIELSTSLCSIVMDSGSLIEAKFDFKQTNLESTQILDEVNLIVESKIHKQYPNLNF